MTGISIAAHRDRFSPSSVVDRVSDVLGYVCAALLFLMLVMICYDVVMRYVFDSPTTWSTEISTYVLVAITFLGAAHTHRRNAHIRVELVTGVLPDRIRVPMELVAAWCGIFFLSVAAWQSTIKVASDYINGTRAFSLLLTPIYLPEVPIPIGLYAFTLAMLIETWRLRRPATPAREWGTLAIFLLLPLLLWRFGMRPPELGASHFDWGSVALMVGLLAAAWLSNGWRIMAILGAIVGGSAVLLVLSRPLNVPLTVTLIALMTLALLLLGIRISLALGLVGLLGAYFLLPFPQPFSVAERSWSSINSFELTAVPMFVLMGSLLLRSGLVDMVFDSLVKWLGRLPGGLAHAGVAACAIFAAVSGSSLATAATMGMVACPEMIKRGYHPRLTYGSIAAGGTLGILIPPSIAMIIYGSTVGASIAALFIAGIIPGLMLTFSFMGVIYVWSALQPGAAPKGQVTTLRDKFASLRNVLPIAALILVVLGSLYAGIATPTEAGAMGAMVALLICLARLRLTWSSFVEFFIETVRVTCFLFLIIIGASIMTYIFDFLRLPQLLVEGVQAAGLSRWVVMLLISLLYIALGMFIDTISMMVMTLPVLFPLIVALGFDPIWFGVVLVILMEIGLITPPVGMNLFVLKGLSGDTPIQEIIYGVLPFAVVMVLNLFLLFLLPSLATWLPERMF